MSGERLRMFFPLVLACIAFGTVALHQFQLPITHGLAVLYLFWGYIEAAAILIILLFWLFVMPTRWPVLLVVLALAVDLLIPFLRDYQENLGPSVGTRLKVITYNWLGEDHDRADAYDWIAGQEPDILAIQEISGQEPGVAEKLFKQFPYHTRPVPDLMIFSKFPISSEHATPVEEHAIVVAKIDVGAHGLTVWGVHPSTLRSSTELAARNYYLATLTDLVPRDRKPILMLGDFNATRWDPYFSTLVSRTGLHEEPFLVPLPTRMGVRSGLPQVGSPIDHILTNRGNMLSDCVTGPTMGSDHRPLVCNLTLMR